MASDPRHCHDEYLTPTEKHSWGSALGSLSLYNMKRALPKEPQSPQHTPKRRKQLSITFKGFQIFLYLVKLLILLHCLIAYDCRYPHTKFQLSATNRSSQKSTLYIKIQTQQLSNALQCCWRSAVNIVWLSSSRSRWIQMLLVHSYWFSCLCHALPHVLLVNLDMLRFETLKMRFRWTFHSLYNWCSTLTMTNMTHR